MFLGIDRLSELAETIRTTAGGVVSLGFIPAFSHIVMPEAVRDLYHARPDVRIMVYTRNTPAIVDAVRMQQFDLGIAGRAPPYEGVEVLFQTAVPYLCLLPESHPLAFGEKLMDLEEVADSETFVTFGGAYPDEMLAIDPKLSDRLQQNSRLSAANMPVAASLVRATGALAIVDRFTADVERKFGGVAARPIRQNLKYHIAVVTRGLDTLPLAAKELADLLVAKLTDAAE
jgi:DNA-binding transcriptional LysR family regulator